MKFVASILLLITLSFAARAQNGKVEIIKDTRVDQLMDLVHQEDAKKPTVNGYRIQVYSSGTRAEVQKMKDDIYAQFPGMHPLIQYQAPNFKLRVGSYRSRMEAYKDLQLLNVIYPNVFIVKDELALSELQ